MNSKEISHANKYFYTLLALFILPLSGVSIDVYVPSLPAVSHYFGVNNALSQLTITTYLFGLGLMQLFGGGISDSFGRKKPFLIAMFIYIITTFSIAFSTTIYQLLLLRLLQGICVGIMIVPIRSIIPDLFEGRELYKMTNYMVMAWSIGPIIAPAIGGYLQHFFGWQANFYFLGIYSTIAFILIGIFLPETSLHRHPFHLPEILKRYRNMLCNREYFCGLMINGSLYSIIILFAIVGPFLIQNILHYSAIQFGHIALLAGLAWFLGAMSNRLMVNINLNTKVKICLLSMLIITFIMFITAITLSMSIYFIVIPILLTLLLGGMIFPNYFALGMALFPKNTGSANALFGSIVFIITGITSSLGTLLKSTNQIPLALAYIGLVVLCLSIYYIGFEKKSLLYYQRGRTNENI